MRKVLIGLVVGLVLFLVLAAWMLSRPRHCTVSRANFERIEKGMTVAEVFAILGGPPGDYRTRPPAPGPYRGPTTKIRSGGRSRVKEWVWSGDEGYVWVYFDPGSSESPGHGTVVRARFDEEPASNPFFLEVLAWRLERLLP
jgi:hypothetical protein